MFLIIILVLFVMTMFLWLLSMLGGGEGVAGRLGAASPWLAWFACLWLGLAVFIAGWQTIVVAVK